MDADFRHYLSALRAEEPPVASTHPRWAETEALARRLVAENKVEAALKALEQEPARKKRWDLLLLTALLREALGEPSPAHEAFEVVADKLMAAGDRPGVEALLDRFRGPEPTTSAVRFLHFLARGEIDESRRIQLLREAIAIRPGDPELHSDLAAALERTGDAGASREHRLRSVELRLELGRVDGLADELLRAIEEDLETSPARIGRALLRFAAIAPWAESEPLLDLALPELTRRAAGELGWEDLAPMGPRVPSTRPARELLGKLLAIAVAREPDPSAIVEGSGIADPTQPIETVLERVPKILALPPGAHVAHTSWGLGRVRASDGENLTLEFPGRAGHRMSFAMASRSLERIPGDGLRVLATEEPGLLRSLAERGDSEVLVRALRDLGGAASATQLRPKLEAAMPGFDWAGYWRQVKDRLRGDPRVDTSEAYRQMYRLASAGVDTAEAALPPLKPRAAAEGLGLIRRFLRKHPEEENRLRESASHLVRRWAGDDSLDPPARAQALCHALSWEAIDPHAARAALERLVSGGLSADDVTLGAHQDQLLDLAVGAGTEEDFLWRAVESRHTRLRERARARLREILGAERYAQAVEARLARPAESPGIASRLIEHFAARPDDEGAPPLATLFLATLRLLERGFGEGVSERLIELLGEDGALRRRLASTPLDPETRDLIENAVLHWAGSERRLLPVLECLRGVGLEEVSDAYELRRKTRAQTLLEGRTIDDLETRFTVMSRPTYDRMEAELRRLSLELKTTIPAAIEKARQLGDLRENAEYEAAKLRQANTAARVQELINTLERTRLLETLEIDPSRVGPGTETALAPVEPGDPHLTFWILGEGDQGLGENVLSYRAPLARPLLGKPAGSEVELPLPHGARRYRIESIARRVPE